MSTSRGSVESAGEFLLDEDGWKSEAEAIIRDVGEFVKVIHVSDVLEVRKEQVNKQCTCRTATNFVRFSYCNNI